MNMFGNSVERSTTALQLFEPDARALYTLEAAATLSQLPRRVIAVYCKYGLVSPVMDPACSGWYFDDDVIRILLRILYMGNGCCLYLHRIIFIVPLASDAEHLRGSIDFSRHLSTQLSRTSWHS